MPVITIDDSLWAQLTATATRTSRDPELLAAEAVREHLERLADEDLLEASAREAAHAPFNIEETEAIINAYRTQHSAGQG